MSTVLIVGESLPSIRILAVSLAAEGFDVVLVSDASELETTVMRAPDLIILDHLEPTDLYRLNPRQHGFSGRLLLLCDEESAPVERAAHPGPRSAQTFPPPGGAALCARDGHELDRLTDLTTRRPPVATL